MFLFYSLLKGIKSLKTTFGRVRKTERQKDIKTERQRDRKKIFTKKLQPTK